MQHEGSIRIPSRRHGLFAFLRQKQWWSFEGLDPTQGLYFVFLALEGLLAAMPAEEKVAVHRQVAEAIEQVHPDDPAQAALLAYHWHEAGDIAKEAHYTAQAGIYALSNGAYKEAVPFLERALAQAEQAGLPPLRRAELEYKTGEAYFALGQATESTVRLKQAAALLGWPVPASAPRMVIQLIVEVLRQGLHLAFPRYFVGRLVHDPALRVLTICYERLSEIAYLDLEALDSVFFVFCEVNTAEAAGSLAELSRGYATISVAMSVIPFTALSRRYDRRAWEVLRGINDPSALAVVSKNTGISRFATCAWADLAQTLEAGAAAAERVGELRGRDECLVCNAWVCYFQGELPKSIELFRKLYAFASVRNDPQTTIWGLCGQVENGLWLGDNPSSLLRLLQEAAALVTAEARYRPDVIRIHGLMARVHLRREEWEAARKEAEAAADTVKGMIMHGSFWAVEGYAGAAEAFLRLWQHAVETTSPDTPYLKARAKRSCQNLHAFAHALTFTQPRDWLWQGVYDWQCGRLAQARRAWERSLSVAQKNAMPQEEGKAEFMLATHSEGAERQAHLARAIEIFERLGAAYDAECARKLLAA